MNNFSVNHGLFFAAVNTGRKNGCPVHARLMHIQFGAVKTAAVIDGCHNIFQRIVRLYKQRLETLHRIRRRVPLGKGVIGKTLDLLPHTFYQIVGITTFGTIGEKFIFDLSKFVALFEFPRHAAAQNIRLGQRETCKKVSHFYYILLVHHHAIGFFQ